MKYLLSFWADEGVWDETSPEQARAGVQRWREFDREAAEAGVLIACEPLQPSATATTMTPTRAAEPITTDGPFMETKEQLGGFALLECADLDEAMEWARRVPLGPPWSIEVRPIMAFDGSEPEPQQLVQEET